MISSIPNTLLLRNYVNFLVRILLKHSRVALFPLGCKLQKVVAHLSQDRTCQTNREHWGFSALFSIPLKTCLIDRLNFSKKPSL
jgi:hypothetical protein